MYYSYGYKINRKFSKYGNDEILMNISLILFNLRQYDNIVFNVILINKDINKDWKICFKFSDKISSTNRL